MMVWTKCMSLCFLDGMPSSSGGVGRLFWLLKTLIHGEHIEE